MTRDAPRLAAARALGVTHAVDSEATDLVALVRDLGDGLGADLVVDATGTSIALKQALDVVRPGGQVTKVGWGPQPLGFSLDPAGAEGGHPAGQLQPHLQELGAGGAAAGGGPDQPRPHRQPRVAPRGLAGLLRRDAQRTLRQGGPPAVRPAMPRLSVFPKCYMDALCVTKTMTLFEWIELAATLGVDGVEMYPGFFESFEPAYLERVKQHLDRFGLEAPMMCASPDFTQPDPAARRAEVEREKHMIDVTATLGGQLLPRPLRTAPGGGLARGRRALDGRVHHRRSWTPRRRAASSSTWRTTTRTATGG